MSEDHSKEHFVEFDLSKLRLDMRIVPVAKYDDGTWGGKVESIMINGLPDTAFFERRHKDVSENKPIYLTIEKGKASLSQPK